jgi:hypothetical protein
MPVWKGTWKQQENTEHTRSINLVILKIEILSALSAVGSATIVEELEQADAAL